MGAPMPLPLRQNAGESEVIGVSIHHDRPSRLRVTEVFHSLQGETTRIGLPTVFIRLTGCPLRCNWCDTPYSFTGGETRSQESLLEQLGQYETRYVCVTGGEPLAQKNCLILLRTLCDSAYSVSLETSGAYDIAPVDPRVAHPRYQAARFGRIRA